MLPSKEEAKIMLEEAHTQNPGPWVDHSRTVARIAETIAKECGLDANRAFVSGLLHDIGRYEGVTDLRHIYAGYELMKSKGYDEIAQICLSHSFQSQEDIGVYGLRNGSISDCTPVEIEFISSFIANTVFDDYDKLIQLGDAMGLAEGVCLIEVRLINVVRRYGFNDFTLKKWDAIFDIKAHFDKLCGKNIYDLFYDEIIDASFR